MSDDLLTPAPVAPGTRGDPRDVPAQPHRTGRRFTPLWWLGLAGLGAWCLFNVGLLVWVVLNSFRGGGQIFTDPTGLPQKFDFVNYVSAWSRSSLGFGFLNSVVLVLVGSLTTVLLSSMAAYVLARTRVPSASPITAFFAIGLGLPVQVLIVPLWVLMHRISSVMWQTFGWWDERISLLILYVATSLPFAVFLLTGFFRSLPGELEEASALDGASPWVTFTKIMWPLARPGLTTAFLLTALGLWNETLLALVFITEGDKQTLPQALLGLYGTMQYTADWGGLFAGIVIIVVPTLIAYFALGRRLVEGMTLGAGK